MQVDGHIGSYRSHKAGLARPHMARRPEWTGKEGLSLTDDRGYTQRETGRRDGEIDAMHLWPVEESHKCTHSPSTPPSASSATPIGNA